MFIIANVEYAILIVEKNTVAAALYSRSTKMLLNTGSYWNKGEHLNKMVSRETINRSKSRIETQEKGVKYVQIKQKHQNEVNKVVLMSLLFTLNIVCTFFFCFYCCFEHVANCCGNQFSKLSKLAFFALRLLFALQHIKNN